MTATAGKIILSFTFSGRDSIIAANTAIRIVSGIGIISQAQIAPHANPIVPSQVLFLFQGSLCLP